MTQELSYTFEHMQISPEEFAIANSYAQMADEDPMVAFCQKFMSDSGAASIKEHCDRTAIAAVVIAQRLQLYPETIDRIAKGAKIHDVGQATPKILAVVQSTERYEGSRRDNAMEIVRDHVVIGARLVRAFTVSSRGYKSVAEIVEGHHSYATSDGYGRFPGQSRVEGEVVAVADVLDALASHRPYKSPIADKVTVHRLLKAAFSTGSKLPDLCFQPRLV